jgi:hypothetical protein
MTALLISVECGEKTCGVCAFCHDTEDLELVHSFCSVFDIDVEETNRRRDCLRCPECLAAEERAKGAKP